MNLLSYANPYLWMVSLRNLLYDRGILKSEKLSVPVISVGNISCGGTGKTTLTRYLAEELSRDLHVGILLRGYRRKSRGYRLILKDCQILESPQVAGDEAYLLSLYFKENPRVAISVCEDRVLGGKKMLSQVKIDLLLLDDGFQHRKIHRDLDLVLIKPEDLKDKLLPFGKLREPLTSLKRADAIILSYQELYPFEFHFLEKPVFKMFRKDWTIRNSKTRKVLSDYHHLSFVAFSGLGDNQQFRKILNRLRINVEKFISLPDHFDYRGFSLRSDKFYITTLKDLAKLEPRENLFYLDFRTEVPGLLDFIQSTLLTQIVTKYSLEVSHERVAL